MPPGSAARQVLPNRDERDEVADADHPGQTEPMVQTTAARTSTNWWIGFHGVFALVAVAVLLVPVPSLGMRVLLLVVGYNIALPLLARRTGDQRLWRTWCVLAPMSVLMVLPDWFLSAVLGSITFPDTGSPYIGTMPWFMAGMWVIALLPVMMAAMDVENARGTTAGFLTAAIAGLALFTVAEWFAPAIPLWEPVGVAQIAGVAVYVLLPELGLCIATYELVRNAAKRPRPLTIGMIVAIPFMYLGMLACSYQFLG